MRGSSVIQLVIARQKTLRHDNKNIRGILITNVLEWSYCENK